MIHSNQQQGIVLVIVLWFLVLLTVLSTSYSNTMRNETRLTVHLAQSARASALAEAGINRAILELLKPVSEQKWHSDGSVYPYQFDAKPVQIQILSVNGKINLNTARVELLHGLFISAGVLGNEALALVQTILDWRDKDNLVRNNGAEDTDYKNAGVAYGAKDGFFNSVDELLLVQGMTSALYQKIRPALTVHSKAAGVYPPSAPKQVLLAIPGITNAAVDAYMQQRQHPDARPLRTFLGIDSKYINNNQGYIFAITSMAKINHTRVQLEALVSIRRNDAIPYIILAWQQTLRPRQNQSSEAS